MIVVQEGKDLLFEEKKKTSFVRRRFRSDEKSRCSLERKRKNAMCSREEGAAQ